MRKISYIRPPDDISAQLEGFYERVARLLGVEVSFVIQVALGERQSAQVEAVLRQELRKILQWGNKTPSRHEALFYSDDAVLLGRLIPLVSAALKRGDPAVIIATNAHQERLAQGLKLDGVDVDALIRAGMYIAVDAAGTLSIFMVDGMPEPSRFFRIVGGLIVESAKIAKTKNPRVAAFGEWVSILCKNGQTDAAIRLEQLWNQLAATTEMDLLCGYEMGSLSGVEHSRDYESISAEHTAIYMQGE